MKAEDLIGSEGNITGISKTGVNVDKEKETVEPKTKETVSDKNKTEVTRVKLELTKCD